MKITIEDAGNSCTLKSTTVTSSNAFTVPATRAALISALTALLSDAEMQEVFAGDVMISRYRDGLHINAQSGRFELPYRNVFSLVLEA